MMAMIYVVVVFVVVFFVVEFFFVRVVVVVILNKFGSCRMVVVHSLYSSRSWFGSYKFDISEIIPGFV